MSEQPTDELRGRRVIGDGDMVGSIVQMQVVDSRQHVLIEWQDGQCTLVPQELLVAQGDGSYFLPLSSRDLAKFVASSGTEGEEIVVPVIAEELLVEKRMVERGGVRIRKLVEQHEELVDEELLREEVEVERVPINQTVETPPEVRYEGDTMIIPLLEEVLVVQKRLIVREELRVTRRKTIFHNPQTITVRREQIEIERLAAEATDGLAASDSSK